MLRLSSHPLVLGCSTADKFCVILISDLVWANLYLKYNSLKMADAVLGFLAIFVILYFHSVAGLDLVLWVYGWVGT